MENKLTSIRENLNCLKSEDCNDNCDGAVSLVLNLGPNFAMIYHQVVSSNINLSFLPTTSVFALGEIFNEKVQIFAHCYGEDNYKKNMAFEI